MSTIKVFTRPFLIPFVLTLVKGNCTIQFNCLAESYAHAVEQALNSHPDIDYIEDE